MPLDVPSGGPLPAEPLSQITFTNYTQVRIVLCYLQVPSASSPFTCYTGLHPSCHRHLCTALQEKEVLLRTPVSVAA
ncbi:hypothetical protein AMELA_G00092540 [Ameiurus melas]|uniref:Uncharacterized protein n=1 Tax=Ameiurus melas TaxID=219545 RepID=A0A7J6AWB1_AMEME|nr:hypothetical protein AMELA_G00092540 [Ameiurus melas]